MRTFFNWEIIAYHIRYKNNLNYIMINTVKVLHKDCIS